MFSQWRLYSPSGTSYVCYCRCQCAAGCSGVFKTPESVNERIPSRCSWQYNTMVEKPLAEAARQWCQEGGWWRAEGGCQSVMWWAGFGRSSVRARLFDGAKQRVNLFIAIQGCKLLHQSFTLGFQRTKCKMVATWPEPLAHRRPPSSLTIWTWQMFDKGEQTPSEPTDSVHVSVQSLTHSFRPGCLSTGWVLIPCPSGKLAMSPAWN